MSELFKGQELLAVRDRFGCSHLIGAIGQPALDLAEQSGSGGLWELPGWNEEDMPPCGHAVYVWEGTAERYRSMQVAAADRKTLRWKGEWRDARADDFARFGLKPLEAS